MKTRHLLATILLISFASFTLHAQHQHKQETRVNKPEQVAKEVYTCPMHPEVVSDKPGKCPECGMKLEKQATPMEPSPAAMMGEPVFEQEVDGINLRVWLITQEEHKEKMKEHMAEKKRNDEMKTMGHDAMHSESTMGMNHDGKEMNMETMEAMMAGTHHVMAMVADNATREPLESTNITITLTSPSKNSSMTELKSMMNHFAGGLTLDEKGIYTLDVRVSGKEKARTASFTYEVK